MGRTHHRKKHKENLRQFKQSNERTAKFKKRRTAGTLAIVGSILGMAIGYLATDGVLLWVAFGAVAVGLAGYLVGRYFDKGLKK